MSCLAIALAVTSTIATAYFRCWRSEGVALAASLADDSFYAILPAWRVWEHGRFTFDGIHAAYGFQPLWEIVLVALAGVSSSKDLFLRLALFSSYLLIVAAALVAGDLVRALTRGTTASSAAGAITTCVLLLNPQLEWVVTGGKETALYLLLLALAFRFTLAPVRSASNNGRSVWVGVLWSLVPLARLTPASLILTGLGFAWTAKRRPSVRSWIAWLSAPVLWAAAAWIMFDHVWPTSGSIKSQRFVEAVSSGRILDDLPAIVGTLPSYALELGHFSLGLPSQFVRSAPALSRRFILTLAAMAALGILVRREVRDRRLAAAALGALASVAVVVAVLRYRPDETYYFGAWYHAEIPLLVALNIGLGLSAWPKALTTSIAGLLAIPIVLGIPNTSRHQLDAFKPNPHELQYVIAETAAHLNSLAGIHQMRIASWNAGLLGFLTNTTVINLDGLANEDILKVGVADASLGGYLLQEGVHLLVDARVAGAPLRLGQVELSIVHVTPWSGPPGFEPGWFVMEVRRP